MAARIKELYTPALFGCRWPSVKKIEISEVNYAGRQNVLVDEKYCVRGYDAEHQHIEVSVNHGSATLRSDRVHESIDVELFHEPYGNSVAFCYQGQWYSGRDFGDGVANWLSDATGVRRRLVSCTQSPFRRALEENESLNLVTASLVRDLGAADMYARRRLGDLSQYTWPKLRYNIVVDTDEYDLSAYRLLHVGLISFEMTPTSTPYVYGLVPRDRDIIAVGKSVSFERP